jgi:hypothetical protein
MALSLVCVVECARICSIFWIYNNLFQFSEREREEEEERMNSGEDTCHLHMPLLSWGIWKEMY